ncbi:hypothetical protein [Thalassospira alkalitolerans]|uniref:Uncharacterized protein n=1 Tax=Thalassospira alkalitolerans TaxID=1293890 RepID=A0A1Y2LB95_9PROT|nr:hypothetical protein [Thalassospira alkalitolerans]OSQ47935.1 hypothetical protein TALK_09970 [Thalassospira alkalitolerans]
MKFNLTRRTKRRLMWASLLALIIATALDGSKRTIADLIWPDDAAPWEKVTAVYYPDREKLIVFEFAGESLNSVAECRDVVFARALQNGDPDLKRGSYECAIGFYRQYGDIGVYRLTVQ